MSQEQWRGHISGRWADDRVLVRLDAGGTLELESLPTLSNRFEVGDKVIVFVDEGRPLGWLLVRQNLGFHYGR